MIRTLSVRNRQRVRRVNTPLLRRITLHVLEEELRVSDFEVAIHLVAAPEMARVNWNFLQHEGSTDVITFDHSSLVAADVRRLSNSNASSAKGSKPPHVGYYARLDGELFICLDDAVKQAREFRTTWQSELTRYVIHGLLHLCGHDDLKPAARRKMKLEENRSLRVVARRFALSKLETRNPKRGPGNSALPVPRSAM
jgi:probable rRNA maturation factor